MDICNRTRLTAPSMIDNELCINTKFLVQLGLWNHGDAMQIISAILVQTIGYTLTNLPNVGQRLMIPNFLFKEAFIKISYKIRCMFCEDIESNLGKEQVCSNPNGGINLGRLQYRIK